MGESDIDARGELERFAKVVWDHDDLVEIRPLPVERGMRPVGARSWWVAAEIADKHELLERWNQSGAQLYAGVLPRAQRGGGRIADCLPGRVLWADFDEPELTSFDLVQRITDAGLPDASMLLYSGGGMHAYWRFDEPVDPEDLSPLVADLAALLGSDPAVKDAARIMRLPGFVNHKHPGKTLCRIADYAPGRVYTFARLRNAVPRVQQDAGADANREHGGRAEGDSAGSQAAPYDPTFGAGSSREWTPVERARAYIARMPAAISGHGGNETTFRVACAAVNDFNLPAADALALLEEYNLRCSPPWDQRDLETFVKNAQTYATKAPGEKLRADTPAGKDANAQPRTGREDAAQAGDSHESQAGGESGDEGGRRSRRRADEEPEEVAIAFLADTVPGFAASARGLVYHRGTFYRYRIEGGYEPWSDTQLAAEVARWCRTTGRGKPAVNYCSNMIHNLRGIGVIPDAWDAPCRIDQNGESAGFALCLKNGWVDLREVMQGKPARIQPHTPDLFSLAPMPFAHDADAAAPRWMDFLGQVMPDADMQAVLQEWFGYCLVPTQKYQKIMLMTGEGANGKSVVTDMLKRLVGVRNCSAIGLGVIHMPHQTHAMVGKLVNLAPEFGFIAGEGEEIIKAISGGDLVNVNPKGRPNYDTVIHARFTVTTNHRPRVGDRSEGLWRRLIVLPYEVAIPEVRQKAFQPFCDELAQELPGILNWAIDGLRRLEARGRFLETEASREIKEQFKVASNPVREFLEEHIVVSDADDDWIPVMHAYNEFRAWHKARGHRRDITEQSFGEEVKRWRRRVDPLATQDGFAHKVRKQVERKRVYAYPHLRWADGFVSMLDHDERVKYPSAREADDELF